MHDVVELVGEQVGLGDRDDQPDRLVAADGHGRDPVRGDRPVLELGGQLLLAGGDRRAGGAGRPPRAWRSPLATTWSTPSTGSSWKTSSSAPSRVAALSPGTTRKRKPCSRRERRVRRSITAEPTSPAPRRTVRRASRSASWVLPTPVIPVTATVGKRRRNRRPIRSGAAVRPDSTPPAMVAPSAARPEVGRIVRNRGGGAGHGDSSAGASGAGLARPSLRSVPGGRPLTVTAPERAPRHGGRARRPTGRSAGVRPASRARAV